MSKAKAIGTKAETAVTRAYQRLGWHQADRRPLKGAVDEADILLEHGFAVVQVKGGNYARRASHELIWSWLNEAEQQRSDAQVAHVILVAQRPGVGEAKAENWWAYMWASDIFAVLSGGDILLEDEEDFPVRMTVTESSLVLKIMKGLVVNA